MPWTPVLDGASSERARAAIDDIAWALRQEADTAASDSDRDPSLPDGSAGKALFFSYLSECTGRREDLDAAQRLLEQAIGASTAAPRGPHLHGGAVGVAWTVEHLAGVDEDSLDEIDPNAAMDRHLGEILDTHPWRDHYDLIGGLVGYLVYAVERLPRPSGRKHIEAIVAHLRALAESADGGLRWLTPPDLVPASQREQAPRGYYNTGLAHGVPGIIAALSMASDAAGEPVGRDLLEGAVAWLERQRLHGGEGSHFPSWVPVIGSARPARNAWCYGDPGVSTALLGAARVLGDHTLEQRALAVARAACHRSARDGVIVDVGLCHGAAGLAHVVHRLYGATRDAELRAASQRWFQQTLDMIRPGQGIGGVVAHAPPQPGQGPRGAWQPSGGLLTGAAGVGLALLAAVTDIEPLWDRCLLMSLPVA